VVIGKRLSNVSIKAFSTIVYCLILLIAVVSFVPTLKFFIFRSQEKHGKGSFAVDKLPWILVVINIMRDSSMLTMALT
jgi:uncharacterized membrane protein